MPGQPRAWSWALSLSWYKKPVRGFETKVPTTAWCQARPRKMLEIPLPLWATNTYGKINGDTKLAVSVVPKHRYQKCLLTQASGSTLSFQWRSWKKDDDSPSTGEAAFLSWNKMTHPLATHLFIKALLLVTSHKLQSQVTRQKRTKGGSRLPLKKQPLSHLKLIFAWCYVFTWKYLIRISCGMIKQANSQPEKATRGMILGQLQVHYEKISQRDHVKITWIRQPPANTYVHMLHM